MLRNLYILIFLITVVPASAQRETVSLDRGWKFAFGNAADPAKDFGCGTEYFNYLTKANSIHNAGPYSMKFDDSGWKHVDVPHDFVVDLPYAAEASHSHGYKTVGWKYPETSVGWYRRAFRIDSIDRGKHFELLFEGIFRDSRVWVNGFYCGGEPSGYLSKSYDITDYLNFGGENIVCVRADATLEEGWFYEGGGIYRHVWLTKTDKLHIAQDGLAVTASFRGQGERRYNRAIVTVKPDVWNASHDAAKFMMRYAILNAEGDTVASNMHDNSAASTQKIRLAPMQKKHKAVGFNFVVDKPKLWSPDTPYLYTMVAQVVRDGKTVDEKREKFGIREVVFDKDRGLILNGKPLKIKGVNMHQDHAGVGAAIPDALQAYRIRRLKSLGCNAYRSSHNPMSPAMLDVCDSLGMLVIDETRLAGINANETSALRRMIERDRNHPSVILWSAGNEEWGIEWDKKGERIAATMRDYCHLYDPSRPMTFATSGGPTVEVPVDVAGYNYIMQNPIDEHRRNYPDRRCYGSEETTGCGTRGVYFPDAEGRWMPALNRVMDQRDSTFNQIERGWRFYAERPWAAGCFFWTGFDYRGEPNPMKFPATGSQFGILDYCGFAKDEAEYLRAWWTDDTVLHILPHWNLAGHEGEEVSVWAYSNCDEVELFCNGKSLGRQTMPRYGHLEWTAVYRPGRLKAVGYKAGRRVCQTVVATAGAPAQIRAAADRTLLAADGADVAVVDITLHDRRGTLVPDANVPLTLSVEGNACILGVGNGNPAMQAAEQPAERQAKVFSVETFNGCAQVILKTTDQPGDITLTVAADGCRTATVTMKSRTGQTK